MEDGLTTKMRQINPSDQNENVNSFSNNFWDEKLSGYDVLGQNLRNIQATVKELELYMRESANNEDIYVKQLNKTTTQMQKFSSETSFSPIWFSVVKDLNEHNSWSHLHFMNRIHELIKEIQSYYNDLRKKKRKFRQNETKTSQLVEQFRNLKQQLNKSKEQYHQMCSDVEKQKQAIELNQQQNVPNQGVITNMTTALTRLEKKCQSSMDEYNQIIEKYNACKVEFEQRYADSCSLFQMYEETHLAQMRTFLFSYTQLLAQLNSARQKNFNECQHKLNNVYTVDYLIEQFIMTKGTGQDRPVETEFVEFQNSFAYSGSYEGIPSSSFNKRRSLTTPVNETMLSNNSTAATTNTPTNSTLKESKKINENKGFSSIFNIRSKKAKKAIESRPSDDGSENSMSFSPNSLKLSSTTPEILSKAIETQLVTHEENDVGPETHFVKTDKNNSSQRSGGSIMHQSNNLAKKRLNSLPSFETKNGNETNLDRHASSFDKENNFFDVVSFNNKATFLEDNLNDNEFEADFFPTFSGENIVNQVKKDNEDMNNLYESSGSFDEERKNIKKNKMESSFPDIEYNESDDDSSDFSDDSEAQKKIFVKINPIESRSNLVASPDILNQVSKSLKLNLSLENPKATKKINLSNLVQNEPKQETKNLLDENNNEQAIIKQSTDTSTTTQTISVSVFGNTVPPPLPPLPLVIKQKFQEQQKRFQQEMSTNNNSQKDSIQKSDPILINNTAGTIKIIKKNLEISYEPASRALEKASNETNRTATVTSNGSNKIRVNIRIPSPDDEMQF